MKRIDDPNRIEALLAAGGVRGLFDTPGLTFQGFCFEKGNTLSHPAAGWTGCSFWWKGRRASTASTRAAACCRWTG